MWNCSSSLWISDLDFQVIDKKYEEQLYPQGPLKFPWFLGQDEYFSGWFGKLQPESLKVRETKSREATPPHTWKYSSEEGAALQNSVIVTLLLWDEGEKYFPDFPLYAFIITAALNFAIGKKKKKKEGFLSLYSPSTNSLELGVASFSPLVTLRNQSVKYNRLIDKFRCWIFVLNQFIFSNIYMQAQMELRLKNPNELSLSHLWLHKNRALLCDIKATNYWFIPRTGRSSFSIAWFYHL